MYLKKVETGKVVLSFVEPEKKKLPFDIWLKTLVYLNLWLNAYNPLPEQDESSSTVSGLKKTKTTFRNAWRCYNPFA